MALPDSYSLIICGFSLILVARSFCDIFFSVRTLEIVLPTVASSFLGLTMSSERSTIVRRWPSLSPRAFVDPYFLSTESTLPCLRAALICALVRATFARGPEPPARARLPIIVLVSQSDIGGESIDMCGGDLHSIAMGAYFPTLPGVIYHSRGRHRGAAAQRAFHGVRAGSTDVAGYGAGDVTVHGARGGRVIGGGQGGKRCSVCGVQCVCVNTCTCAVCVAVGVGAPGVSVLCVLCPLCAVCAQALCSALCTVWRWHREGMCVVLCRGTGATAVRPAIPLLCSRGFCLRVLSRGVARRLAAGRLGGYANVQGRNKYSFCAECTGR